MESKIGRNRRKKAVPVLENKSLVTKNRNRRLYDQYRAPGGGGGGGEAGEMKSVAKSTQNV